MQLTSYNARKWNTFALSILGLAIAVFAWGVHYKVSLYKHPPTAMHHGVSAKLLSDRERPVADISVEIERATTPVIVVAGFCAALVLFTSLLLDPKQQSRWVLQRRFNSQRRPLPQVSRQLFFRPPPSF